MKDIIFFAFKQLHTELDSLAVQRLESYAHLLIEWNKKMNLTAITSPEEIAVKHFADSAAPLCYYDFKDKRVIDVGTGAGFPGLPLKIIEPQIELTLVDSLQKRVDFLNTVCNELQLDDVECIHARAEELARDEKYRESFDIAVSRAVAPLNILCEYDLPYVKEGGCLIALKGKAVHDEIQNAQNAAKLLGGEIAEVKEVELPLCNIKHYLVKINKISPTDSRYPRRAKKINTQPL